MEAIFLHMYVLVHPFPPYEQSSHHLAFPKTGPYTGEQLRWYYVSRLACPLEKLNVLLFLDVRTKHDQIRMASSQVQGLTSLGKSMFQDNFLAP